MTDTAYNPTTNEAVRFDGNEWIPTDVATNPETGEIAIFDGAEWIIRKKDNEQKTPVTSAISDVASEEQSSVPTVVEPQAADLNIPVIETPTLEEKKEQSFFERFGTSIGNIYDLVTGQAQIDTEKVKSDNLRYQQARDELEKKVQEGTATGSELRAYSTVLQSEASVRPQVIAKVGVDAATAIPDIGMMIADGVAPETAQTIRNTKTYQTVSSIVDAVTPELTDEEEIAAELLGLMTVAGLGKKVAKEGVEIGLRKLKGKQDNLVDALTEKFGDQGQAIADNLTNKYGREKAERLAVHMTGKPLKTPKVSKADKVIAEVAGTAGGGLAAGAYDLTLRDEDDIFLTELIDASAELSEAKRELTDANVSIEELEKLDQFLLNAGDWVYMNVPDEVLDAADALEINPNDSRSLKVKKQFLDAAALGGTGAAVGGAIIAPFVAAKLLFRFGRKGINKKIQNIRKQIDEKKKSIQEVVEEVPAPTKTAEVKETVIEETPSPTGGTKPKQRNIVTESIAKINTGLGRAFRSNAALPEPIFKSFLEYTNADKAASLEIKKVIKDLKRVQAKTGDTDEDIALYLNEGIVENLSSATIRQLDETMGVIRNQENKLNDYLNLSGDNKLGIGFQNGDVYLTRTFEAAADPSWFAAVEKGLKGKLRMPRKRNADIMGRIERAREYFNTGPGAIPKVAGESAEQRAGRVDALIERVVANVSKVDRPVLESIFDSASEVQGMPRTISRSLKARKNIDQPVLDLLGEVKDPYRQLQTTLLTQRQLLSSFKYLNDIAEFAAEAGDKTVNLGGMFKFLPTRTTGFGEALGQRADLGEIADEMIGRFGGGTDILQNVFTTPAMAKYIKNGTELVGNNTYGSMLGRTLSRISGFGQATQTVLDVPAYVLNAWGAIQGLGTNGYLVNVRFLPSAIKQAKTFSEQVRAKDAKAIEELSKLKRQGVIDSDVTGEMLYRNSNFAGNNPMSLFGKMYGKAMEKAGRAYGAGDTYAKLIAHRIERQSLAKAFPEKSADEIFDMASDVVRDVMPSYTTSAPAARALSRLPFGTYAMYPTEVVRTYGNILRIGAKDVTEGLVNKNGRQLARGLQRLGSLGAVNYGMYDYITANNSANGITEDTQLAIDLLSPDYAMAPTKFFTQPFRVDPETGNIMGRYTSSAQFDAYDFIKTPVAKLTATLLSNGNAPQSAIDEIVGSLAQNILSPYTNPKFVTEAAINILSGVDENGRPIYDQAVGATFGDKVLAVLEEAGGALEPGTSQVIRKYIQSLTSEEIRDIGQSASGFPLSSKDIETWMKTGVRPNTMNLDKAVGFDISKDIKTINATKDNFLNFVRQIPDQQYTPEIEEQILNEYRNLQNRKRDGFKALSDKLGVISKIQYQDKQDKTKTYGLQGIVKAATDKGFYNLKEEIPLARATINNADKGVFRPDDVVSDKRFMQLLRNKDYPISLIQKIQKEYGLFAIGRQ